MNWLSAEDYWLSRFIFQRALALVFLIAFLNALNEFKALLGEHGIVPAPLFIKEVAFRESPSLFYFWHTDAAFTIAAPPGGALGGDVYVAPEVARENARRHGAGVREEVARLVVHGVLHVLGNDHPDGEARTTSPMWRRQEALLARLAPTWRA